MHKILDLSFVGVTLLVLAACSETPPPAASGGAAGASGGAGSAGAPTSAGSGTGGAMGGAAGGMSGGTTGGGAAGAAGSGGASGAGGAMGGPAKPSAGCGKANPPDGARTIMTGDEMGRFNVNLPDNYNPATPMPLGFGFHGNGNDECGPDSGECRGFAMLPAVTVYMKSLDEGWEQAEVLERNVTYWQDVLALMKNEYCIDENRIFVAGVSSGGQFIEHLTCRFGDQLWQTTAVCAAPVNPGTCMGTPPILVIHGVDDDAGDLGNDTVEVFAERNGCSTTPPAGLEQARADLTAAREAEEAEHICLDWEGCTANPVRFCISSQITYDNLTHGWPEVGGQLISEFHATLE